MMTPTPSASAMNMIAALLEQRTGQQIAANRAWRIETALKPLLRMRGLDTLDDEALNRFLMERLPVSMKPTGYQLVEAFPTTPNGKIDYKALARSVRGKQDEQVVRKPATDLEQQVLDIWRDVLRQDAISTTSSFFDIGGDSLLLVEVRNRIKQRFGLQVATTTLFEYPTIASLAGFLARQQPADADLEGIRQRAEQQRQAMGRPRQASREVQPNV